MNKQILTALTVVALGMSSSHAGLFDTLAKVNQAVGAVRGNAGNAAAQQANNQQAQNANQAMQQMNQSMNQAMQSYAGLDCASLNGMAAVMQQQMQSLPQQNQVSKTAGMLGKAGGLFASVGAMAGINTNAIQQANQLAQQADSLSANTATNTASAADLNQQLAALQVIQQAKACQ